MAALCALLLGGLLLAALAADRPTLKLSLGRLRGTLHFHNTAPYHSYRGVPYAEPPERFQEAVEKKPWTETLDATQDAPCCLQDNPYVDGPLGDPKGRHDCLFLNVYTPAVAGERDLPVIVFIHGGGYSSGQAGSEWLDPKYFMDSKVVVVTVAYRLGVFGFLCTGDDSAPANLGLRDQVLALRWVRKHIDAFGGSNGRVTLQGHDAGGASVHLHMVSPLSRGLFQRAVSQSGVWLSWWLGPLKPLEAQAHAQELAKLVGCNSRGRLQVNCLRSEAPRKLLNATMHLRAWSLEPLSVFRPCVDDYSARPFLPDEPLRLLQAGQASRVPWLLGVTEGQGLFRLADIMSSKRYEKKNELRNRFDEIMPTVLGLHTSVPPLKVNLVWNQIRLLYYGSNMADPFVEDGRVLSNLYADRYFLHGWRKAIVYHYRFLDVKNIYAYVFGYSGTRSFQTYYGHGERRFNGPCHGDDLLHLFEMPALFSAAAPSDERVITAMVALWTTFAKNGAPTPHKDPPAPGAHPCWPADGAQSSSWWWRPATEDVVWHLDLFSGGQYRACQRADFAAERLRWWDELPLAENLNLSLASYKLPPSPQVGYRESVVVPSASVSLLPRWIWVFIGSSLLQR